MHTTEDLLNAQVKYLKDIRDILLVIKDQLIENGNKLEKLNRSH